MIYYIIEMFVGRNPYPFYIYGLDCPDEVVQYGRKYVNCKDRFGDWGLIKHDDIVSITIYQQGTKTEIADAWENIGK